MSIFDKLLASATGSAAATDAEFALDEAQEDLLRQTLRPLAKISAAVCVKAMDFVFYGTEESVLLDLYNAQTSQTFQAGVLFGSPGRLRGQFYHHQDKALEKLGKNSLEARHEFYKTIDATKVSLALLVRLGKVIAVTDGGKSLDHPGAPIPDWLQYLINDAYVASVNWKSVRFKNLHQNEPARPFYWDVYFFSRLLDQDDLDPMLALQVVFERKGIDSNFHQNLAVFVKPPAVAQFMLANQAAVHLLPTQLSAPGRAQLAQRVGADKSLAQVFAPLTVRLAADSSKAVRTLAGLHLVAIDTDQRLSLLGSMLNEGSSAERSQAADLLGGMDDPRGITHLQAALAAAPAKSVAQAIRAAINRIGAAGADATADASQAPPCKLITQTMLGDAAFAVLKRNRDELLERARLAVETLAADANANKNSQKWAQENYTAIQKVSDYTLRGIIAALNGGGNRVDNTQFATSNMATLIWLENRLRALPECGVFQTVCWASLGHGGGNFWGDSAFQKWIRSQASGSVDLRALAVLLEQAKVHNATTQVARASICNLWGTPTATQLLPAHCVWPFFAEHPELVDEGLGLVPSKQPSTHLQYRLEPSLELLAIFPTMPARWFPRLMELALGEAKAHRGAAQKALLSVPDLGQRVVESLDAAKIDVRIEAANWLATLQFKPAVPALMKALKKETRETARAAFIQCLEALGEDISPWLSPEVLLAEAQKGLKAKAPTGLAWFMFDALPRCQWRDGTEVAPEILRWWVVFSCKLKEPGGNALLSRYLGLLAPASGADLSRAVLQYFIYQDTRAPDLAAGIAHAQAHALPRWHSYQNGYANASEDMKPYYLPFYLKSQDQVFEDCKREKMREYFCSAIGEKGILALVALTPPLEAVSLAQQFMRDHHLRRHQIEAVLEGIAAGGEPLVIQLLLGISRRYRTASVQEKARFLVQKIADSKQWTQDQLADRTTPTAGLDESGKLELDYGGRTFTLVLDAAMKLALRNPEGKEISALPEPRQNDDVATIKEAKSQLSNSKKELKQVIDSQTARLSEAMCVGRLWPQQEWHDYLHAHPIVGRLTQRLVWLELDGNQTAVASFRPSEDGNLINTDDNEITLKASSLIRLAHASIFPDATVAAWQKHLKDYKVTPLFAQLARKAPAIAFTDNTGADVTEITDRLGWVTDSFTLRGALVKLGFQRAQAEDGGFFYRYLKTFATSGLTVMIEFSGNSLPEENVPVAMKGLSFENTKTKSWGDRMMALKNVPPVLLAEAYADYLAVAQKCAGFDAEWENKLRW